MGQKGQGAGRVEKVRGLVEKEQDRKNGKLSKYL